MTKTFFCQAILPGARYGGHPSLHDCIKGGGEGEDEADMDKEAEPSHRHKLLPLLHV